MALDSCGRWVLAVVAALTVGPGYPAWSRPVVVPSASLRTALFQAYRSPEDVLSGFRNLQSLMVARRDPRIVFLEIYVETTEEISSMLERGEFEDGSWMRSLLVRLADLYRQALLSDEVGPRVDVNSLWQFAFDANRAARKPVPAQLLISMNAHISSDLLRSLLATGTNFSSAAHERDFFRIKVAFQRRLDRLWAVIQARGAGPGVPVPRPLKTAVVVEWTDSLRRETWRAARRADAQRRLEGAPGAERVVRRHESRALVTSKAIAAGGFVLQ